jgi:hypothetical protein
VCSTWTSTGNVNTAPYLYTARLLPKGMVVAARGHVTGVYVRERGTGRFREQDLGVDSSLNTRRVYHTTALLSNGMVLVAAGIDDSN